MKLTTHPASSAKDRTMSGATLLTTICLHDAYRDNSPFTLYRVPKSVSIFQSLKVTALNYLLLDKISDRTSEVQ
jgi:hypothetical protein